jgi:hypothetical protein
MILAISKIARYPDLLDPLETVRQSRDLFIFHRFDNFLFDLPVLLLLFDLKLIEPLLQLSKLLGLLLNLLSELTYLVCSCNRQLSEDQKYKRDNREPLPHFIIPFLFNHQEHMHAYRVTKASIPS